jgi:hypothetical protein
MKNLILLFLVIGAAVSTAVTLTNTTGDYLWTLEYKAVATGQFYSFVLTFTRPSIAATAAQVYIAADSAIGVVCVPSVSTFAVTAAQERSAFVFSTSSKTGTALNDNAANWDVLVLTHWSSGLYNPGTNFVTGGTVITCGLVGTGATTPVITNGVVTWTFTVAAACLDLPQMGTGWFAKCFATPTVLDAASPALVTQTFAVGSTPPTLLGALDVTFPGTTTVCALNGASTFATGATILAGIAYLQF